MSLCRLPRANNRSRMFIASFLAIALHVGLINFEFVPEPISVPEVSLPRSISVSLGQKSMVAEPEQQPLKTQTEPESYLPTLEPAVPEKKDFNIPRPELSQNKIKQQSEIKEVIKEPFLEKKLPAEHEKKKIPKEIKASSPTVSRKTDVPAESQQKIVQRQSGVLQPGTVQTAYPRYNENSPPPYPRLARKRGQEGTTILQVLVNKEGRVADLKIAVSSNFSLLDRAAMKAVRKWSFEPGRKGQERISMWVKVPLTFKLKK